MTVVLEFSLPSEAFTLGAVLREAPAVAIKLERIVPTGNKLMPFFWAEGTQADLDDFEQAVRSRKTVTRLVRLDDLAGARLYEVEWTPSPESLIEGLVGTDGTIFEGRGFDDRWRFVVRFPDHERVAAFHNFLTDHGIEIHIDRLVTLTESERGGYAFDLSPEQREVLVRAVDGGYFEVPRGIELDAIAEELDITPQAASERLRRGVDTVLRAVLLGS